jgi:predicted DNA repair protein MutK
MKALAVVGTAAMFLVGGGILVHGMAPVHHAVEAAVAAVGGSAWVSTLLPLLADAVTGVVAGGLVLLGVTLVQRVRATFK